MSERKGTRRAGRKKARSYESELRRARAEETTEKILASAAELARELPSWDWQTLTVTAVADRAGVGRRTVYRHFDSQAALHASLLAYLQREAGVSYENLTLDDLPSIATKVFAALGSFAAAPWAVLPAPFPAVDAERRAGLRRAVQRACADSDVDATRVAAALDVVWQATSFEILLRDWGLEPEEAQRVLHWLHRLVLDSLGPGD